MIRVSLGASSKSPAVRVLLEEALWAMPEVRVDSLLALFKEHAQNSPNHESGEELYRFGRIMMDQNEGEDARLGVDWSQSEFVLGRAIALMGFEITNPGDELPEVLNTPRKFGDSGTDLDKERQEKWNLVREELESSPSLKACKTSALHEFLRWEKKRVTSIRENRGM
jgi:hypothetical protein